MFGRENFEQKIFEKKLDREEYHRYKHHQVVMRKAAVIGCTLVLAGAIGRGVYALNHHEPDKEVNGQTVVAKNDDVVKVEVQNADESVVIKKTSDSKQDAQTKKEETTAVKASTKKSTAKSSKTYRDTATVKKISVAKSKKVADSYFNDAVFIGDSRTQGLQLNNGLSKPAFYAERGLAVNLLDSKAFVSINHNKMTVVQALKKKSFKKVYIMFGINELGWYRSDLFIKQYKDFIKTVKKAQPNAVIYVQGVIPVTNKKSSSDKVFTNTKIYEYNEMIAKMVKEVGVNYLNVGEAVRNKSGELKADASSDGIHMNKKYCELWYDYLKTHTVKKK